MHFFRTVKEAWGEIRWKMLIIFAFFSIISTILVVCFAVAGLNVVIRRESAHVIEERIRGAGGNVLITPFTAYQSWDGVFRGNGFGANLRSLDGVLVRTARRIDASLAENGTAAEVRWSDVPGLNASPIGVNGFCEFMETDPDTEIIGRFHSDEVLLENKAAAIRRRLGKGTVIKLAFWPEDDSVLALIRQLVPSGNSILAGDVPPEVQAVPRSDDSLFIINTSRTPTSIRLRRSVSDVVSGTTLAGTVPLRKFEVLWLQ